MNVKIVTTLLLLVTLISQAQSQTPALLPQPEEGKTFVFRFFANNDMFFVPFEGNGDQLNKLVATVERYKSIITSGQVLIHVDGYSTYFETDAENRRSAAVRANRVKSELIIRNGILEEHFRTRVHAAPFGRFRSAVVVTMHIPPTPEQPAPEPAPEPAPQPEPTPEPTPAPVYTPQEITPVATRCPLWFDLRANLLHSAALLPTLGIEWRAAERLGIKVDGSRSHWGSETGNVQKIWIISPEIRYYLGTAQRFYIGAGANFGQYNVYGGAVRSLLSKESGYQGSFWNAGATAGYRLPLSRCRSFALDFNLGVGYNSFSYDTFTLIDGVRVYQNQNLSRNNFGITQAGISLIWRVGRK